MKTLRIPDIKLASLISLREPAVIEYHQGRTWLAVIVPLPTPENIERIVKALRDMAEGER